MVSSQAFGILCYFAILYFSSALESNKCFVSFNARASRNIYSIDVGDIVLRR